MDRRGGPRAPRRGIPPARGPGEERRSGTVPGRGDVLPSLVRRRRCAGPRPALPVVTPPLKRRAAGGAMGAGHGIEGVIEEELRAPDRGPRLGGGRAIPARSPLPFLVRSSVSTSAQGRALGTGAASHRRDRRASPDASPRRIRASERNHDRGWLFFGIRYSLTSSPEWSPRRKAEDP
eukprot:gene16789-biopygen4187